MYLCSSLQARTPFKDLSPFPRRVEEIIQCRPNTFLLLLGPRLIKSVKEPSDEKGLFLNIKKTKIMDIDKCKKRLE